MAKASDILLALSALSSPATASAHMNSISLSSGTLGLSLSSNIASLVSDLSVDILSSDTLSIISEQENLALETNIKTFIMEISC